MELIFILFVDIFDHLFAKGIAKNFYAKCTIYRNGEFRNYKSSSHQIPVLKQYNINNRKDVDNDFKGGKTIQQGREATLKPSTLW